MQLCVLDCETTGTNPTIHSVIQIAMEYWRDGELIDTFNKRITNDSTWIDLFALKVNKVPYSSIKGKNNEQFVVKDLVDFFFKMDLTKPIVLVGQNVNFDISFIEELLKRHQVEGFNAIFSYRVLDTASIGLFLQRTGLLKTNLNKIGKGLGLESLAEALNIEVDKTRFHDALYDIEITRKVYFKMESLITNLKENKK